MQMEKKEAPSTNPVGVCEKLFNALSMGPAFRPLRRISHPSQTPPADEQAQSLPASSSPDSSCTKCHGSESKPPVVQKPVPTTDSNHAQVPKKSDVAEVAPTKTKPVQLPPPEEKPKPVTGPLGTLMAKTSSTKPKPPPPSAPLLQPTVEKPKPVTGPPGGHITEVAPDRSKPLSREGKMKPAVPPPSSTREKGQLPNGSAKLQSAVPPVSAGEQQKLRNKAPPVSTGEREKLANKVTVASSPAAVKGHGDAKVPPPTATGDIDAETTSYITRAKMKIRAMSGKPSIKMV